MLTALYDAIHAVALTTTGATSLMHEAKVDVVTVPNLSEHLSNAATTAQLSARFGYAAAMKSLNNLLLLGDGETWARQRVDFAGLPEMVRTFLQVAAGAADIPVTRLLGQSPAGLSATGDSDIRNYYDMIAARQEIDLRPQLERLDRLLMASAGVVSDTLGFTFRPLWQMDAATKAATALQKAQATGIYAGLGLWPTSVMAGLVAGQLAEDGIYPDAGAAFAAGQTITTEAVADYGYDPGQLRDPSGQWTSGGTANFSISSVASESHTPATQNSPQKPGHPIPSYSEATHEGKEQAQLLPPDVFLEDPPITPNPGIPYPEDPTVPPAPGYVWRGRPGSQPGDPNGSWHNPETGESLHPDLHHKPGMNPIMIITSEVQVVRIGVGSPIEWS